MAEAPDLAVVETRLRSILDRYRDRLEAGSVYGMETIKRPGVGAHDFFAGVSATDKSVSFYLKPVYTWPALLDGMSPELRKRMKGSRTAFGFTTVDDPALAELDGLTERAFAAYMAARP